MPSIFRSIAAGALLVVAAACDQSITTPTAAPAAAPTAIERPLAATADAPAAASPAQRAVNRWVEELAGRRLGLWCEDGTASYDEIVITEGTMDNVWELVEDGAGGHHQRLRSTLRGVRGVTEGSGESYLIVGDERQTDQSVGGGMFRLTLTTRLIGQGSAVDLAGRLSVHYLASANGETRLDRFTVTVGCR